MTVLRKTKNWMFTESYKLLRTCIPDTCHIITKALALCTVVPVCLAETHSVILEYSRKGDANSWNLHCALWPGKWKQFHPTFFIFLISSGMDSDRILFGLWLEEMMERSSNLPWITQMYWLGRVDNIWYRINKEWAVIFVVLSWPFLFSLTWWLIAIWLFCHV